MIAAAREHADAIVIGSGFGGAVAAYRLAAAGLSVVVLERGRAYPPGSFGRSPAEISRALWNPPAGRHGLFDLRRFRACDALVASGLGGGSLIYANVLLRKDESWFVQQQPLPGGGFEAWPVAKADLDPHYDEVERMLGATPYPLDQPPYRDTPKTHELRRAAARLRLPFSLPLLAVSFAPTPGAPPRPGQPIEEPAGNLHDAPRRTCRLCGECNIGCNDGAKNTLDLTYLSAAARHGADLRVNHEVRLIRPDPRGGYVVEYRHHDPDRPSDPDRLSDTDRPGGRAGMMHTDRLVLAAGTLGTTELLLRSRRHLPGLSQALGTRFSANGDRLGFAVGAGNGEPRAFRPSHGPVITGAIRLPDDLEGDRGGYVQDGGYPGFVGWLLEAADLPGGLRRAARFLAGQAVASGTPTASTRVSEAVSDLIGAATPSETALPLLAMGRDVPDGVLRLRHGVLDLEWTTRANHGLALRRRKLMRGVASALGAGYHEGRFPLGLRDITVHPLGGAPMGRDPHDAVCDEFGAVFGHPGLYIMDGAAMPGPVGGNPALTIAAFADRAAIHLLDNRRTAAGEAHGGRPQRHTTVDNPARTVAYVPRTSVQFCETLRGTFVAGLGRAPSTPVAEPSEPLSLRLTVTIDDIDEFLESPEHRARADGWIDTPAVGGRRPVSSAWVHLSVPASPDASRIRYLVHFADHHGAPRTLSGVKNLTTGPPTLAWSHTTTLPYRLLNGDRDEEDEAVGAGVLRLRPIDLLHQIASFRTTGAGGVAALHRFGGFFLGHIWSMYHPY